MSPPMSRWLLISAAVLLVAWRSAPVAIARPAAATDAVNLNSTADPSDDEDGPAMLGDMPAVGDVKSTSPVAGGPDDEATHQPDVYSAERDKMVAANKNSFIESENVEKKYVNWPTPDKELRLESIWNKVMNLRGMPTRSPLSIPIAKIQPNVSVTIPSVQQVDAMREFYDNAKAYPTVYSSDGLTEKTQSFYPICELPKNMNEEIWNSKESMNLMFNISVSRSSNGMSMNVSSFKLRLYKQFVSCYSQSSNETDDTPQTSCQSVFSEDGVKRSANTSLSSSSAENMSLSMEDRQIRVSIYVRSLKKKKVKRRLLDSRMISYYGEKWTEWNIYRAVKSWRNSVRNFALSIEVEDEYGNFLPVNRFFKSMNCTGDAQMTTQKPIPGFLTEAIHLGLPVNGVEATNNMSAAQAISLNLYRYPIVDVTMVEWLEPEDAAYQQAKDTFKRSLADAMQKAAASDGGAESDRETSGEQQQQQHYHHHHHHHHHRIRHGSGGGGGGNRNKINSTDVQSADAKLARDHQSQQQQPQVTADAADGDDAAVGTEIPD